MVGFKQEGVTRYDDITSSTPVGKILKITNANPAKVYFTGSDPAKFKKDDRVYITRIATGVGREIFNDTFFLLDPSTESSFILKRVDGKTIDTAKLPAELEGGYAQLMESKVEEPEPPTPPEPTSQSGATKIP